MPERARLGRSEVEVSPMGVGVMTWGGRTRTYGGTRGRKEEAEAFDASIAAGITWFDTAEIYGRGSSEERLGELTEGRDVLIASKFMPLPPRTAAALPKALDRSLARLHRRTLDLYQIHFPVPWVSRKAMANHLADAVAAGKVRAVGVSNYSAEQMRETHAALEARGIPLASNQVEYSLLNREPESNGVLQACRDLDVSLIAYMPLAMGALTGKYDRGHRPPDFWRNRAGPFRGSRMGRVTPVISLLRAIGEKHARTPGQVALRWLIEQGTLPIPGAKDAPQAIENAGALAFKLGPGDVRELADATSEWM